VMLVLLVIFMVVTPMLQKGVSVDLAQTDNPQSMADADKEDALLIAVLDRHRVHGIILTNLTKNRDLLRIKLRQLGHKIEAAEDGTTGLEKLLASPPDIALVDIGLPGMNGADAAKKMIHMKHNVKCLIATGYLEPNQKSEIFKSGVKEIIQKPYNPIDVLRKVREVLDVK